MGIPVNFIGQYLSNLTSAGKLYLAIQVFYILCGIYFLYVQSELLRELKVIRKINLQILLKTNDNNKDEDNHNHHGHDE